MTELAQAMAAVGAAIEAELERVLPAVGGPQARLREAMRYAVLGGGKRLRPVLVAASAQLFDADRAAADPGRGAIELLHGFSLVHDDLPAMDDAALRRGRPSCHRAFDEATAILVGDALQALAFELLARGDYGVDADTRCALVRRPRPCGRGGRHVRRAMIDLLAERQP